MGSPLCVYYRADVYYSEALAERFDALWLVVPRSTICVT